MIPDPAPRRYRRRHRWPMLVVIVVLLVGAVVVWTQILKPAPPLATGCNEPGPAPTESASAGASTGSTSGTQTADNTGNATNTTTASTTGSSSESSESTAASSSAPVTTTLGAFVDPNVLAATRPADPGLIPVRVLNASDVTGQAKTVTDELRSAGFSSIEQQANDPLYPAWDLRCYGEIRYGYAGIAEARTVLLVAPCAQLVRDGRSDNSVDLSLGQLFQVEPISKTVLKKLTKIKNAAAPPPVIEGQTISVRTADTAIPPLPDRNNCPG